METNESINSEDVIYIVKNNYKSENNRTLYLTNKVSKLFGTHEHFRFTSNILLDCLFKTDDIEIAKEICDIQNLWEEYMYKANTEWEVTILAKEMEQIN